MVKFKQIKDNKVKLVFQEFESQFPKQMAKQIPQTNVWGKAIQGKWWDIEAWH